MISFSAVIQSKKATGEADDAFEDRVWRERMHRDANGEVFIPGCALKNCLADTARYLSERVPGKKSATYTKHFKAGIMVVENLMLGVQVDDVDGQPKPRSRLLPSGATGCESRPR